jgi:hypothetical protein
MRETSPAEIETQIHQPRAAKQVEVHGRSRSRDRRRFHEARTFDAVHASVWFDRRCSAPRAYQKYRNRRQAEKCRRQPRRMICAATSVLRQVRGHIDPHKTHFACRAHSQKRARVVYAHKISSLLSRPSSPVLVLSLRHELRARKHRYPPAIEQPCIPTTIVDVKMSAHHIVHGLRRKPSLPIPFTREAS